MGMIGFQSQCAVRRLMPGGAVRRHIARAERLNSVARSAGRLPRPRDVVTRSRVSFRQACGVSLVRRYLRPEVTTPTRFYPEDRAARLFLPCSIRLISSLENFSGS